jgi:hypothetical protein
MSGWRSASSLDPEKSVETAKNAKGTKVFMGLLSHTAPVSDEYPIHPNTVFLLAFLVPWRFQLPKLG